MRNSEVQITSLLSGEFGSGRWSGGRATTTDAWYEYRQAEGKRGKFTVIESHIEWTDTEDEKHEVRYGVGSAEFGAIREEPDESSNEAERGYGISGRNGKAFKINADSEFGQLLLSLYTNGVPESRVGKDIRGVIGVEAELVERPHSGKKQGDDRYPMLLASQVYGVGGESKSASTSAAKGKSAVAAADEDERPSKQAAGKNGSASQRARKLVIAAAKDNDGNTTASDVIRSAAKSLKGDDDRKDILDLLGDDDWLAGQDGWSYKRKSGEIELD